MQTVILPITSDTFVSSAQPNQNFSKESYLFEGFETWSNSRFTNCIKFDTTGIPHRSHINSAKIKAYVTRKDSTTDATISVNRIISHYDAETVTYNTLPDIQSTGERYSVKESEVGSYIYIDISTTIQKFVNGSEDNFGIALTGDKTILSTLVFGSIEEVPQHIPEVIVNYDEETQSCENASLLATYSSIRRKSFARRSNLVLDTLNASGTICDDLAYSTETGNFTINTDGQYLLNWSFNLSYTQEEQPSCCASFFKRWMKRLFHMTCIKTDYVPNLSVALLKNGLEIYLSGVNNNTNNGVVNGSILISAKAGDVLSLVNYSMIFLSTDIEVEIVPSIAKLGDVSHGMGAWVNIVKVS